MQARAGFTYDPLSAENTEDPYPAYETLLAEHPIYHNPERDFWALCRFDDVKAALRDWKRLSSAGGVRIDDLLELAGPSPLTMDPPRHGALRSAIRPPFAVKEMPALAGGVETQTALLLDALEPDADGVIDVARSFAKQLPVRVIALMLGIPVDDAGELKALADAMLETVPGEAGATDAARRAAAELRQYWLDAIADRRVTPADDLISAIAHARVDDEVVSVDEQVGMCNLVFEAGNATTSTLIANAILALGEHPEQQRWLRENPDAMPAAIEEFVRYESPVQGLLRTALVDIDIHGATIPAGARVLLVLGAANRDPRIWDEPNQLDLTRDPEPNLAFGDGIHLCLGAPLARLEAPIALRQFLERYPSYEIVGKQRFHDVSMRTLSSLRVKVA